MNKAKLLLQKVYTVSEKHEKPRLWLQSLICETAGFTPGGDLFVRVDENEKRIVIQNQPYEVNDNVYEVSVSSRVNRTSGLLRPLVDTCGAKYSTVLNIQDKVEISVYRLDDFSQVVVRPLQYRIFDTDTFEPSDDERLRLISICSGSGIGTSMFCDTQYYTAVQEVEIEDDSAEVLKHNFPHSFLFNGDLRDCNTVAKADVALVTLSCKESSTLGDQGEGYFDNLVLGTYRLLKAAEPRVIFFENVPGFYNSSCYKDLQQLLTPDYGYQVGPIQIDSYDFGSIAHRKRGYVVFLREREDFEQFREPKAPAFRRFKLKEYLEKGTQHSWKSLESWLDSFSKKSENNNSWADRSTAKTFVSSDATELQCIPGRYRSHSASNSYVLSDDGTQWRFLTIPELRKIFQIPSWFCFPDHVPITRVYEMIGQSVCGRVMRAFANEFASMFFRRFVGVKKDKQGVGWTKDQGGQIGFIFG